MGNTFWFIAKHTGFFIHFPPFRQIITSEEFVIAEQPQKNLNSRRNAQLPDSWGCIGLTPLKLTTA